MVRASLGLEALIDAAKKGKKITQSIKNSVSSNLMTLKAEHFLLGVNN